MNYIKFKTNIPETMTFQFDSGLEKPGQYGMQYAYKVIQVNGEEAYLYATEVLNGLLQKINPLRNVTLTISKVQDPNDLKRTHWAIEDENGVDITPGFKSAVTPQKPSPQEGIDPVKLRQAFKKMQAEIDGIYTLLLGAGVSEDAIELHKSHIKSVLDQE